MAQRLAAWNRFTTFHQIGHWRAEQPSKPTWASDNSLDDDNPNTLSSGTEGSSLWQLYQALTPDTTLTWHYSQMMTSSLESYPLPEKWLFTRKMALGVKGRWTNERNGSQESTMTLWRFREGIVLYPLLWEHEWWSLIVSAIRKLTLCILNRESLRSVQIKSPNRASL